MLTLLLTIIIIIFTAALFGLQHQQPHEHSRRFIIVLVYEVGIVESG
jgi:hypothetical protein